MWGWNKGRRRLGGGFSFDGGTGFLLDDDDDDDYSCSGCSMDVRQTNGRQ